MSYLFHNINVHFFSIQVFFVLFVIVRLYQFFLLGLCVINSPNFKIEIKNYSSRNVNYYAPTQPPPQKKPFKNWLNSQNAMADFYQDLNVKSICYTTVNTGKENKKYDVIWKTCILKTSFVSNIFYGRMFSKWNLLLHTYQYMTQNQNYKKNIYTFMGLLYVKKMLIFGTTNDTF